MKKSTAIFVLGGGNMVEAARELGCTRQAVQKWPTDEFDNITSKAVVNAVIAALVRKTARMRQTDPSWEPAIDAKHLDDLLTVPADE